MRRTSPLGRLSQRVRRTPPRAGLAGLVQRVAVVLLPPPSAPPPTTAIARSTMEMPGPPYSPEQHAARERARRALIDARRTMTGVIGEEASAEGAADGTALTPVTPD